MTINQIRGYRILEAIINNLNEVRGMSAATDVVLTGCSGSYVAISIVIFLSLPFSFEAGGLAVYLHADYVGTLLADGAKYKAFPDAG